MAETFTPIVSLKKDECCSFARHLHPEVAKDLIYYLEAMARMNKHRFVWIQQKNLPAALTRMLNGRREKQRRDRKSDSPKPITWEYSHAIIERYIKLFRELGIITVRMEGENRPGEWRWGIQVLRHDDVTRRVESGCEWIGLGLPPEVYSQAGVLEPPFIDPKRRIGKSTPRREYPVTFHTPPDCPCDECQRASYRAASMAVCMGKSRDESTPKVGAEVGAEVGAIQGKVGTEVGATEILTRAIKQPEHSSLQEKSRGESDASVLNFLNGMSGESDTLNDRSSRGPLPPSFSSSSSEQRKQQCNEKQRRIEQLLDRQKGTGTDWTKEIAELKKEIRELMDNE
jgi:hypothetical protein